MNNNFVVLSILLFSALVRAEKPTFDFPKAGELAANRIFNVVSSCGERIWPGYDLKKLNIVFVDSIAEKFPAISLKEARQFKIDAAHIPLYAKQGMYSFFTLADQKWMAINTEVSSQYIKNLTFEKIVSRIIKLTVHESFHHTVQTSWPKTSSSPRGTLVPVRWEPRFYRAMIFKNLELAYADRKNSGISLQRTKYWYNKWLREFENEAQGTTDGYEGSARYADVVADALTNLGCEASEELIHSSILAIQNVMGVTSFLNGTMFGFDTEGYAVGAMAALILRRDHDQTDWKALVSLRQTPLEILMRNVQERVEEIDEEFKQRFVNTQLEVQSEIDGYLGETYSNLDAEDSFLISLPYTWLGNDGASYSFVGFYVDLNRGLNFSVLDEALKFQSADKLSFLESAVNAAYLRQIKTPCKDSSWVFPIARKNIKKETGGKYKIESHFFKGELAGKILKADDNRNWLCAGEN